MTDLRPPRTLQTAALTDRIDPAELRGYLDRLRAAAAYPAVFTGVASAVPMIVGVIIGLGVVIPAISVAAIFVALGDGLRPGLVVLVVLALGVVAIGVGAVVWWSRTRRRRWFRLARFAEANGLDFQPEVRDPYQPGVIFGIGDTRRALDLVRDPLRSVEIANYRYTTGSGKSRSTHRWGYVAIRLRNPLPNIVLDATSNNTLFGSNLPAAFDRHQRLHLEGDFDRHFTLYCPQGYERDALYLFTPDIMARFIDHAAALDVEIVDDRLLLYSQRELSTLDPATWAWLLSIVDALEAKFAQWERWRDDRLAAAAVPAPAASAAGVVPSDAAALTHLRPPPGVAPQGRRLRRGISWATVALVGVLVVFWILGRILEAAQLVN